MYRIQYIPIVADILTLEGKPWGQLGFQAQGNLLHIIVGGSIVFLELNSVVHPFIMKISCGILLQLGIPAAVFLQYAQCQLRNAGLH